MVTLRLSAMVSTVTLVIGALLVGDAIHGAVVTGAFGVASPAAAIRLVGGLVLIWVGLRTRVDPTEYARTPSDEPAADDGDEFDPELSPVGDSIEGAERDEESGS